MRGGPKNMKCLAELIGVARDSLRKARCLQTVEDVGSRIGEGEVLQGRVVIARACSGRQDT